MLHLPALDGQALGYPEGIQNSPVDCVECTHLGLPEVTSLFRLLSFQVQPPYSLSHFSWELLLLSHLHVDPNLRVNFWTST